MKNRWLLQTLILSAAFNVVLIAIFFYFLIRDNPLPLSFQPSADVKIERPLVKPSFITKLRYVDFESLVQLLNDNRVVEHGYRVSDFAAAALVHFHDIDLFRALGKTTLPQRKWVFEEMTFTLYPGLTNEDLATLAAFIKQERYPYNLKGLLERIEGDAELSTYFCHTPPFVLLETLFARAGVPISRGNLLRMVQEGGGERLSTFYQTQEDRCDLSAEVRQKLLLDYIEGGSKTAASLLLITDPDYAYKGLEDREVVKILELLDLKTEEARTFAQRLAESPRGDQVRELAGRYSPRPASGELRPSCRSAPLAAPPPSTHLIQPGESLWLIARKYKCSLERLMEMNRLTTTVIQPGKTLQIPPKT